MVTPQRADFVRYATNTRPAPLEWRLWIGRGVKFRADAHRRRWRVDCYPGERTAELDGQINRANRRLATLEVGL